MSVQDSQLYFRFLIKDKCTTPSLLYLNQSLQSKVLPVVSVWWRTLHLTGSRAWYRVHPGWGLVLLSIREKANDIKIQTMCNHPATTDLQLPTPIMTNTIVVFRLKGKVPHWTHNTVSLHSTFLTSFKRCAVLLLGHTTGLRSLFIRPCDCAGACWGGGTCSCCWVDSMTAEGWTDGGYWGGVG